MYLRNTFGMLYHSTDNSNTLTFNVLGGNLQLMLLLGRKDP